MFRATRALFNAAKPAASAASSTGSQTSKSAAPQLSGFQRFYKHYLSDSGTYPIFIILGGACVLLGYHGSRLLFKHPDVNFNKDERTSFIRDNEEAGQQYQQSFMRAAGKGNTQIVPGLNKLMVEGKVKDQ